MNFKLKGTGIAACASAAIDGSVYKLYPRFREWMQEALSELTTEEADVNVALFSALKKSGVGDAAMLLHSWIHTARETVAAPSGTAEV